MNHQHKATHTATTPYTGPVSDRQTETARKAQGGVCYVETCKCGATRKVNVNGANRDAGEWRA